MNGVKGWLMSWFLCFIDQLLFLLKLGFYLSGYVYEFGS